MKMGGFRLLTNHESYSKCSVILISQTGKGSMLSALSKTRLEYEAKDNT
jgi:UDP-N-acetylglucosamine transferase subunit ALG13